MVKTMTPHRFHWPGGATNEGRGKAVADVIAKPGFWAATARSLAYYEAIAEPLCDRRRHKPPKRACQ